MALLNSQPHQPCSSPTRLENEGRGIIKKKKNNIRQRKSEDWRCDESKMTRAVLETSSQLKPLDLAAVRAGARAAAGILRRLASLSVGEDNAAAFVGTADGSFISVSLICVFPNTSKSKAKARRSMLLSSSLFFQKPSAVCLPHSRRPAGLLTDSNLMQK